MARGTQSEKFDSHEHSDTETLVFSDASTPASRHLALRVQFMFKSITNTIKRDDAANVEGHYFGLPPRRPVALTKLILCKRRLTCAIET